MQTPLWLNLKKEYIDDNFENLLGYLKNYSIKDETDTFYDETIGLLRERVRELVAGYSNRPIYEEIDSSNRSFSIRLLSAYLMLKEDNQLNVSAYLTLMFLLMQEKPEYSLQIMKNVGERLRHSSVDVYGFYWSDIINYSAGVFAHKAIKSVSFGSQLTKNYAFERHGSAIMSGKSLYLFATPLEKSKLLLSSGVDSLSIANMCTLRTSAADKLKQSLENNLVEIDKYMTDFCAMQAKVKSGKANQRLHIYSDGDKVNVRVTDVDYIDSIIHVETVDPNYEQVKGRVKFKMPSLLYYYTSTLPSMFRAGNMFPATIEDVNSGIFNIEKELIHFIVEDCRENYGTNEYEIPAVLIDNKDRNYYGWITDYGVPIYTASDEDYEKNDYALLNITDYMTGRFYGRINGEIIGRVTESSDKFIEKEARLACIQRFANSAKDYKPVKVQPELDIISEDILAMLIRLMFFYQRDLLKPSDRFRFLMNARAIASLIGDSVSESYIRFASTYLMILVQFTCNGDISAMKLTPDEMYKDATSTAARMLIVSILKRYGHEGYSEELAHLITEYEQKVPIISKLARLVQTVNTTSDMLSSSAINIIRREIIRTLSLETENDTNLEDDSSEYLGVESGTQEFKESIVFPPDNHMQPDLRAQSTNIMRGICAFLNSETGGTLYLGVNDQGYVIGLDGDMNYLKRYSIDSYMRYVQDEVIARLGVDAASYLHIEPRYDNRCLAIRIDSHPHRVVELDKIAYMRINNETRRMPDSTREALIKRKYNSTSGTASTLFLLHQAMAQHQRVVLHNYASSSSLTISDRAVEVYDIRQDDNIIIGYDIERTATRVYNINRIGYVELTDEPWRYASRHEKILVDDFHMTGTKPISVSLQLDLFSCNLMKEEFPSSKHHLAADKNGDRWFYNADVYRIDGIGRFYMGLANHITILKAPELVQYVKDYKEKYL